MRKGTSVEATAKQRRKLVQHPAPLGADGFQPEPGQGRIGGGFGATAPDRRFENRPMMVGQVLHQD
ncbi:MAG: hypothetical protein QOD39_3350 [Mycobacterium sp.]|nr:hypothetical protein [Mycobacterium sp.]